MEIIKIRDKLNREQLEKVVNVLNEGGLVVYPTETCYGVGALATSERGVTKLLEYKQRPVGKAISVAVLGRKMAKEYVEINGVADNFYENFLPGPYTIISESRGVVDKRLESEIGTLGIRIPDHIVPLQISEALGAGISSTSANAAGKKTPYKIEDIFEHISERQKSLLDIVIDYGELPHRPSSTVVDTTTETPTVLRGEFKPGEKPVISHSLEETFEIAGEFIRSRAGEGKLVVLLSGNLGAGKTQFVKGIAQELGITDNIVSPTFIFERQYIVPEASKYYPGYKTLYHYDLWRLEKGKAHEVLESIGLIDALRDENAVISIEWPERVEGLEKILEDLNLDVEKVRIKGEEDERKIFIN